MTIVRTILIVLIALASGSGVTAALARNQPELTPLEQRAYIAPELCVGEPANLGRILELSTDALATPEGTLDDLPLLAGGQLAEADDAAAVRELMQTMLACVNANDPRRFLSLFTDDFFRHYSADIEDILEAAVTEDGTVPLDDGYAALYESAVYHLEDGRLIYALALAWIAPDAVDDGTIATELIQIAAIEIDGVWKIDDLRFEPFLDPNDQPDCGSSCAATPELTGNGYAGWIMPIDIAEASQSLFVWGETMTGFFEPSGAEIAEAEAVFMLFLNQNGLAKETGLIDSVSGDWRQYFGYETERGRLLVVNGFCDPLGIDPAEQVVSVDDGGACFWNAIYNLDTRRWERLSVNGEA